MRILTSILLMALSAIASAQTDISVDECGTMIASKNKKLQIIDVRTKAEYDKGHIEGAKLADWKRDDFDKVIEKATKKKRPTIVYCRTGIRSKAASKRMVEMGYKQVYNLRGGYMAWSKR